MTLFLKQKTKFAKPLSWNFLFNSSVIFSLVLIIALTAVFFIPFSDGVEAKYGDVLYLGFYSLEIATVSNVLSMNWIGWVLIVLVIINTALCCITYWIFRWGNYYLFIKKHTLSIYFGITILFILYLTLINILNRPLLDLRHLDIVNNGFGDPSIIHQFLRFNFLYNIYITNFSNASFVSWQISAFGWIFITIIICGAVAFLTSLFICIYFKNKKSKGISYA